MAQLTQLGLNGKSGSSRQTDGPSAGKTSQKNHKTAFIGGAIATALFGAFLLETSGCSKSSGTAAIAPPAAQMETASAVQPAAMPPAQEMKPAVETKKKTSPQQTIASYKNSAYGLSIQYPRSYGRKNPEPAEDESLGSGNINFTEPGGKALTTIVVPKGYFPGTDLDSAFLTVSANPHMTAAQCSAFGYPKPQQENAEPVAVKMGGNDFASVMAEDATEDHATEVRYYHTFQNDNCYEFALGMERSQTDGVKPVSRDRVFRRLEWMLSTVKLGSGQPAAANTEVAGAGSTAPTASAPDQQ